MRLPLRSRGRHRPTRTEPADPYKPAFSYRPPEVNPYPGPLVQSWEASRTWGRMIHTA